jgi:flavorubredoxin
MNHKDRTSHDNQRGRPLDFFVDHFLTKCEVWTSKENKEEVLLISLSTSSKPSMKKRLRKKIKEEGLMKLLSTSLKPSVKKGLHKIIKEEGLLISLSTSSKQSMKKGLHKKIKEEGL